MTRTGVLCWFRCLLQPNQEKEVSLPKDMEEYRFGKVRNMICLFYMKGASMSSKTVSLTLADSTGKTALSEVFG